MNQLVPLSSRSLPVHALVPASGDRAQERFIKSFSANIRNRNTRRAYAQAVGEFLAWCEHHRVPAITAVQPVHVAGYIEELTRERSAPTAKQRLSAIRHLFDWLVVGQVMPVNPASSVRGPSHVVKRGKTAVLSPGEARRVLDAIDVSTHAGLRDRALIGLMVFSFARIGAALAMKVEDVFVQDRGLGAADGAGDPQALAGCRPELAAAGRHDRCGLGSAPISAVSPGLLERSWGTAM
jgi:integrase/recombinase XerC